MRYIIALLITFTLSFANNEVADEFALEGVKLFHDYDYDKAIYLLKKSLNRYKDEHDSKKLKYIYLILAKSYFFTFQYKEAEEYFTKSLSIEENMTPKNYAQIMDLYAFLAFCYELRQNYDLTLYYLDKVIHLRKKYYQSYSYMNNIYLSYYVVYKEKKRYKKALNYLYKALEAEKGRGISQDRLKKYRTRVIQLRDLIYPKQTK
jgi:tetratricopeptide (TPR) repeat protein